MHTEQEKLYITYEGKQAIVTSQSDGTNTFFTVHLSTHDVRLTIKYIDDNPVWVENGGAVTQRAEEIGRLIEEYDGR